MLREALQVVPPTGGPPPAPLPRDRGRRRKRHSPAAAAPPLRFIGATYLHASSGRPVVVVDHECRRPRADGARARTGRFIVRCADTPLEILFLAKPEELLQQLTLPCVAPSGPLHDGGTP